VKVQSNLSALQTNNLVGKPFIERGFKPFDRYRMVDFNAYTVHIGVDSAVGSAATLEVFKLTHGIFKSVLENLLDGDSVFLNLPSVEILSVI
jgi:hypothetical protein